MKMNVIRGTIELISPVWTRSLNSHQNLEVDVRYTEVFLDGRKEPIEFPGEVPLNLVGRTVKIVEFSHPSFNSRYENVSVDVFSNPKNTPLYSGSYKRSL